MIALENRVVQLCLDGAHAEFEGQLDDAHALYWQAWDTAQDDYEACIAAHYVARFQETPVAIFHWNREALRYANAVADSRVEAFFPSLYLCMGYACDQLGDRAEAQRYYDLAAALGYAHHDGAKAQARGSSVARQTAVWQTIE